MPVPVTNIRTSHAISIKAAGQVVGQIRSWAPSQSRDIRIKYEINAVTQGNIVEHIPGNQTSQTIQVVRVDLYTSKMEEIWGLGRGITLLCDQSNPFVVEEKWIKYGGDSEKIWGISLGNYNTSYMINQIGNTDFGRRIGFDSTEDLEAKGVIPKGVSVTFEKFRYTGCWLSQLGRTISSEGDRMVIASATLSYTRIRKVL